MLGLSTKERLFQKILNLVDKVFNDLHWFLRITHRNSPLCDVGLTGPQLLFGPFAKILSRREALFLQWNQRNTTQSAGIAWDFPNTTLTDDVSVLVLPETI